MLSEDIPVLHGHTKYELIVLAKKLGVRGYTKLTKEQLIDLLKTSSDPAALREALGTLTWWEKHRPHVYSLAGLLVGVVGIAVSLMLNDSSPPGVQPVSEATLLYKETTTADVIVSISRRGKIITAALEEKGEKYLFGSRSRDYFGDRSNPYNVGASLTNGLQYIASTPVVDPSKLETALIEFDRARLGDPQMADPYYYISKTLLLIALFDLADRGLFKTANIDDGPPRIQFLPDHRNSLVLRAALETALLSQSKHALYTRLGPERDKILMYSSIDDRRAIVAFLRSILRLNVPGEKVTSMAISPTEYLSTFMVFASMVDNARNEKAPRPGALSR